MSRCTLWEQLKGRGRLEGHRCRSQWMVWGLMLGMGLSGPWDSMEAAPPGNKATTGKTVRRGGGKKKPPLVLYADRRGRIDRCEEALALVEWESARASLTALPVRLLLFQCREGERIRVRTFRQWRPVPEGWLGRASRVLVKERRGSQAVVELARQPLVLPGGLIDRSSKPGERWTLLVSGEPLEPVAPMRSSSAEWTAEGELVDLSDSEAVGQVAALEMRAGAMNARVVPGLDGVQELGPVLQREPSVQRWVPLLPELWGFQSW